MQLSEITSVLHSSITLSLIWSPKLWSISLHNFSSLLLLRRMEEYYSYNPVLKYYQFMFFPQVSHQYKKWNARHSLINYNFVFQEDRGVSKAIFSVSFLLFPEDIGARENLKIFITFYYCSVMIVKHVLTSAVWFDIYPMSKSYKCLYFDYVLH